MKTFSHVEQYLAEFFLEWELFQIKVLEKIKTRISHSVTFVWKYCHLWDNVKKCGAREATDNMVHACCVLVKWCYMHESTYPCLHSCTHIHQPLPHTHTHTEMHNTYCFSMGKVVLWMCLSTTLYIHCLSCQDIWKFCAVSDWNLDCFTSSKMCMLPIWAWKVVLKQKVSSYESCRCFVLGKSGQSTQRTSSLNCKIPSLD